MHATSVSGYSLHYFLILHSQSRAQNKFGTFAGCVDRPKKLKLGHVSRLTGQNVKNNPITTWTCLVQMTSKRKVCLDKWSSWLDIVCWPAVMLSKWRKKKDANYFYHLPSFPALLASVPCGQQFKASVYRLIASSNELDLNCLLPMSFKTRALSSSTWEKKSKRSLPKAISSWIHSLQNGRRKCYCKYKWREMQTP